jgi:hypothetical protein
MPAQRPALRAKKPRRDRSTTSQGETLSEGGNHVALQRNYLHDVVNQLMIISLACFELRTPESKPWNDSQRRTIDAIETAVQTAGELAVQLAQTFQVQSSKKQNAAADLSPTRVLPANNVYPISPYLTRR